MRAVNNPRRRCASQVQNTRQPLSSQPNNVREVQVCDSMCNIPCEQVNLVVEMYPRVIMASDRDVTMTFVATNTGSQNITSPVVIVSSLLGNILLSRTGLNAGQSVTVNRTHNIYNVPFPSHSVTNVSYVAYGNQIPGGYSPGERLSKIVTTSSDFQSSPTGGVSINSSGDIIDPGDGVSIITMSFVVTSGSSVNSITVSLSGILDSSQGVTIIRNPNNMFQITNTNLTLAPGSSTLNPGSRYVVVLEGVLIETTPYCDEQSCVLTYSASSSTSTNPNLTMVLNRINDSMQ